MPACGGKRPVRSQRHNSEAAVDGSQNNQQRLFRLGSKSDMSERQWEQEVSESEQGIVHFEYVLSALEGGGDERGLPIQELSIADKPCGRRKMIQH